MRCRSGTDLGFSNRRSLRCSVDTACRRFIGTGTGSENSGTGAGLALSGSSPDRRSERVTAASSRCRHSGDNPGPCSATGSGTAPKLGGKGMAGSPWFAIDGGMKVSRS